MICEICGTNKGKRVIAGIHMCEECFSQIAKLRNGDKEALEYLSTPQNLRNATETAKKYINEVIELQRRAQEEKQFQHVEPQKIDKTSSWPQYDVVVTTTDNISGREISDYLGIIAGRAYMSEIMALLEGSNRPDKPNDAAKETLRYNYKLAEYYLKKEAAELGANAVIGVVIQHVRSNPGLLITMTGTAVIVK